MERINILEVAGVLGLERISKSPSGSEYPYVCPFCGDKRGKFTLNSERECFQCFKCGNKGSMLSLYKELSGEEFGEGWGAVAASIHKRLGNMPEVKRTVPEPVVRVEKRTGKEALNTAYRALLKELTLSKEHKEELMKRGLTEEQVKTCGFRSMTARTKSVCDVLLEKNVSLKGVPGFYPKGSGWRLVYMPGILCPVEDGKGHILGAQVRLDRPKDGCKYVWLSSGKYEGGAPSGSPASCIIKNSSAGVIVTEGILKAAVTAELSGQNTIGVPGVSTWRSCLPYFEEGRFTHAFEAYDMDKLLNARCLRDAKHCDTCDGPKDGVCEEKAAKRERISAERDKLAMRLSAMGVKCISWTWDKEEDGSWAGSIKGIDDLLAGMKGGKNGNSAE